MLNLGLGFSCVHSFSSCSLGPYCIPNKGDPMVEEGSFPKDSVFRWKRQTLELTRLLIKIDWSHQTCLMMSSLPCHSGPTPQKQALTLTTLVDIVTGRFHVTMGRCSCDWLHLFFQIKVVAVAWDLENVAFPKLKKNVCVGGTGPCMACYTCAEVTGQARCHSSPSTLFGTEPRVQHPVNKTG